MTIRQNVNEISPSAAKGALLSDSECIECLEALWAERHGVERPKPVPPTRLEKFMLIQRALTYQTDACIEWPWARRDDGYGLLWIGGKLVTAHRYTCEKAHGPAPKDKPFALHAPIICNNRACCNPAHLRWGSIADNIADSRLDGSMNSPKRTGNKLSYEIAQHMRQRYAAGEITCAALAIEYEVSRSTIYATLSGRSWAGGANA